jgi:signal transduction histidine kinase
LIFDPFFTTKSTGLGLGLNICQSIIEKHGGRMWAISKPGNGAAIHFLLPLAKKEKMRKKEKSRVAV